MVVILASEAQLGSGRRSCLPAGGRRPAPLSRPGAGCHDGGLGAGEIRPSGVSRVPSISNAISLYIFSLPESGRPARWGPAGRLSGENRRRDHAACRQGTLPSLACWGQLQLIFPDGEVDGAVLDVDPVVVVGHLHLDAGKRRWVAMIVHVGQ